jgi:hypothetical protein
MNKYTIAFVVLVIITISYFVFFKKDDQRLCHCVEVGELVNHLSASFFNRPYSTQGKDSLDQLLHFRDSICAPFIEMPPAELHEAAKQCSQLQLD